MSNIKISHETLRSLKRAHKAAVTAGAEQFTFDGNELLTSYAGYLIEHMENILSGPTAIRCVNCDD